MKARHKKMARCAYRMCQVTVGPSWGWKWREPSQFARRWAASFRSAQ